LNRKVVLLQPTALVNEVFVALLGLQGVDWQNRAHFFGMAATLMRNILIDYIRKERKSVEIPLDEGDDVPQARHLDVEALNDALNSLAEIDSQASQTVELRFFAGLTQEEIAEVTGRSLRNAQRKWSYARAWLSRELTRK
jgi:RNA polymerase sigma factor (TIGR02999 family)